MTWRAFVEPDHVRLGRGVAVHLGQDHGDGSFSILHPAELVVQRMEPDAAAVQQPPFLRIEDDMARGLLDALAAHYGGTADMRQLRKDYEAERARVDKMLAALTLPHVSRGTS